MIPPTAGPAATAALNIVEFRAIAFVKSSRPTISITKDCRAGTSKAFTTPSENARTMICQGATTRVKVSADRMKASAMLSPCVTTRRLRLGTRSAMTPPYKVKTHIAAPDAKLT